MLEERGRSILCGSLQIDEKASLARWGALLSERYGGNSYPSDSFVSKVNLGGLFSKKIR